MASQAAAAAAAAVAVLGDDLLREVFVRLPTAADLLRAALACKPFLRAARHAAFHRRFRAVHPSPPVLLGFLFLLEDSFSPPLFLSAADAPAEFGAADFSLSFLPGVGPWPAAAWTLLDCRDGRSLLQNWYSEELAVADPLARAYLLLPALDPKAGRAVGYGLVVDDEHDWAFRVCCVAQDRGFFSTTLRALVLSSDEFRWDEVGSLSCVANLAVSRAMHANGSLYWRLDQGARMVALDYAAAPEAMEFSVIDLPPSFSGLSSFDVVEKGEAGGDGRLIYLLAMRDYRVERWVAPASRAGGRTWKLLDKSVRFYRALESMFGAQELREHALVIIGVVDGVVFLRQCGALLSIDLETMKLTRLSEEDCSEALICPFAKTRAWPPSFLKPTA